MEHVNENSFISLCLLIVLAFFIDSSLTIEFTYKDVDSWPQINPQCSGQRQSPVSLKPKQIHRNKINPVFNLVNMANKPSSAKLMNDGHGLKMEMVWDENKTPFITGEALGGNEYVLDSIDFHWSRSHSLGSEHIIFNYPAALEMHAVYYNRNYGSVKNALYYPDGLAIIGSQFEVSSRLRKRESTWDDNTNSVTQPSPGLSKILNNVESVSTPGSSVDIEPFALDEFRVVPMDEVNYLSYLGSMTTPPCTENVLWLLSTYPHHIDDEQLKTLQSTVEFANGDDHNNRDVQPMNGRQFAVFTGVMTTN